MSYHKRKPEEREKYIELCEDIYKQICYASELGKLNLFVGAGFTKHLFPDKAFSWQELLMNCNQWICSSPSSNYRPDFIEYFYPTPCFNYDSSNKLLILLLSMHIKFACTKYNSFKDTTTFFHAISDICNFYCKSFMPPKDIRDICQKCRNYNQGDEKWDEYKEDTWNLLNKIDGICTKHLTPNSLSCPELASAICWGYANHFDQNYEDVVNKVKQHICKVTSISESDFSKIDTSKYESTIKFFEKFQINSIYTTNYDSVLEYLLKYVGSSLEPIHIHGKCSNPSEIIITNEDYVNLLNNDDYISNVSKMLDPGNITLILGYGVNDIDVLTVIDKCKTRQPSIIQLSHMDSPKYVSRGFQDYVFLNRYVIEYPDLEIFLKGLLDYREKHITEIHSICDLLVSENLDISTFIQNQGIINEILHTKSKNIPVNFIFEILQSFLKKVFSEIISQNYDFSKLFC